MAAVHGRDDLMEAVAAGIQRRGGPRYDGRREIVIISGEWVGPEPRGLRAETLHDVSSPKSAAVAIAAPCPARFTAGAGRRYRGR